MLTMYVIYRYHICKKINWEVFIMKTGIEHINQIFEIIDQLNKEFHEAQREINLLELKYLLTKLKTGKIDKEEVMQYFVTHINSFQK
jgi:hypothetical protein